MSGMLLTDAERQRFVEYLENEIASSGAIIEQAEKMKLPQVFMDNYKRDVLAMLIIAKRLRAVEVASAINQGD